MAAITRMVVLRRGYGHHHKDGGIEEGIWPPS